MKKIITLLAFAMPSVAFAQALAPLTNVNNVTSRAIGIGNTIIYLLVALAVIFIVWNIVMYLIKGGDEEGRKNARNNILWGIVGLAIIVSIWGLVNILTNTFATTPTNQPIPNLGNGTSNGGLPGNQVPQVY